MSLAPFAALTSYQHDRTSEKIPSAEDDDGCPSDFQYIQRIKDSWTQGQISIQNLCEEQKPRPDVFLVFLPAETDLTYIEAHKELSERYNITASFWTPLAKEASGFFRSQEERDDEGKLGNYSSQFRFLVKQPKNEPYFPNIGVPYCWHRLAFSTYWNASSVFILCFDLPTSLKDSLMASLPASNGRLNLQDPFLFHSILVGEVVELYNNAVWSWRDLIRGIEKNRVPDKDPQPDYVLMHEMARHAIHSSELLAMSIETVNSTIQDHETFIFDNNLPVIKYRQTERDLRYFKTLLTSLHLRSKALEERLKNEINLAFNVVAQHDSRVAMRIADATQVDSASMKTVATLGLVFLPGTFICAIFSTTFFNYTPSSDTTPQSWTMSEKFWIYWAVAIPVTGATILFWSAWQKWQASRSILKRPVY